MTQISKQEEWKRLCDLIDSCFCPYYLFKRNDKITINSCYNYILEMNIRKGEYKWLKEDTLYSTNKESLRKLIELGDSMPMIENCWFGADTTTILWTDGTKTTVKCQDGDFLDDEKGVLACIAKKAYGNTGKFNNYVSKAIEQGEDNFLKMCKRKMKKDGARQMNG